MAIHQDQLLQLRQHSGVPEDQMPVHVTGGIPIQRYLQNLLDRNPDLPLGDAFVLTPSQGGLDSTGNSRSTLRSDSQLDDSALFRQAFLHDFIQWTNRHVRVKINVPDVEQPCYVWQSVLEVSSHDSRSNHSDLTVDPLEVNIDPQDAEADLTPPDPLPVPEPEFVPDHDLEHSVAMFRR